ncbi:hypothetical protein GGS21DRAFT_178483 [Xylaria nigripes]|nr:hypothetical protein GGS21DRAFT_178483 [Xylaria nigripes]
MATQKSAAKGALPAATKTCPPSANTALEGEAEQSTPYSRALSRLEPLLPVLAGLAHRNRNQHRHSAWWRYFGMLRRNCAKLTEHLISAIATARKTAARAAKLAKAKDKKRRREELVSGGQRTETGAEGHVSANQGTAGQEVDANVSTHVVWLRDVLNPKCYLAFSQLTADTQFAPLGVVLIGVLAQVQAACDCAAPGPLPSSSTQKTPLVSGSQLPEVRTATIAQDSQGTPAQAAPKPSRLQGSKFQTASEERSDDRRKGEAEGGASAAAGKIISREDVERANKRRQKEKQKEPAEKKKEDRKRAVGTHRPSSPSGPSAVTPLLPPPGKSQALFTPDGRREDEPPAKKIKTALVVARQSSGTKGDNEKKTRKNKKAKKGDEFDDLFKGLF